MKTFIYTFLILIISLTSTHTNAQDIFIGTWEYQQGNEIFRVILEPYNNSVVQIVGHYEKVQVNNGIESYIYCSNKEKFVGNNQGFLPFVMWLSGDNQAVGGAFTDNTVDENLYSQQKRGQLIIEILTNSGGLNPTITASWKVERKSYQGVIIDEAPNFSVPTDIILTKVN